MNAKGLALVTVGFVTCFGFGFVSGHQAPRGLTAPPFLTEGRTDERLATIDLGAEIECLKGRQLIFQITTWEPGGAQPMHSHKDAPFAGRMLQGTMTEHREDGTVTELKAGENWVDGKDKTHWVENRGTTRAIWIVAGIPRAMP